MRRTGDGFEPISWETAYTEIGQRMRDLRRKHGKDSVGLYQGNPTAHSTAVLAAEIFKKVLGSRNIYSAGSVDQFPQYVSSMLMFGDHTMLPVADIDRTDYLLVIGANPAVSNGSLTTMPDARGRLKAVQARGGRVVVLDPRRTETARLASEHVSIRPGGDPYLLLAMLNVIFAEGLDRAPSWADGLDEVRSLAAQHPPRVGSGGLRCRRRDDHPDGPRVRRRRLRRRLRPDRRLPPRHRQCHALADQRAQHRDRQPRPAGRRRCSPHRRSTSVGCCGRSGARRSTTSTAAEGPASRRSSASCRWRRWPTRSPAPDPASCAAWSWLPATRPSPARTAQARGGDRELELLVCIDFYISETGRHADYVLPPVSHLERSELDLVFPAFSVRNNVRYSPRAFEPATDAQEDWDILQSLTAQLPPTVSYAGCCAPSDLSAHRGSPRP